VVVRVVVVVVVLRIGTFGIRSCRGTGADGPYVLIGMFGADLTFVFLLILKIIFSLIL
jgi:hypothetical protein